MQRWILEAILTLANLTPEKAKREELYARAEAESSKQNYDLGMDEDQDDDMMTT
jgi:hypothetical protein